MPARRMLLTELALIVALGVAAPGCIPVAPPVLKIGLVAPFEGRYREIGDQVVPAVRLALREYAAQAQPTAPRIELVAYDDEGDPSLAAEQARKLVGDPEVRAVIGHWREATTDAAWPIYRDANLILITDTPRDVGETPSVYNIGPSLERLTAAGQMWMQRNHLDGKVVAELPDDIVETSDDYLSPSNGGVAIGGPEWGLNQFYALTDNRADGARFVSGAARVEDSTGAYWTPQMKAHFVDAFKEGSLGAPPGLHSVTAFEAAWLAINLITAPHQDTRISTPFGVFTFGNHGRLVSAPVYLYTWKGDSLELVDVSP